MWKKNVARKAAVLGLLSALAILFGYVESILPINLGIPGIKLGLCNVVILIVLLHFGWREAVLVSAVRVVVIGFLFGNLFSIAYSLGGAMLSILISALLLHTGKFHVIGISAAGGAAHNIGQILIAFLVTPQIPLMWYMPVLMLAGLVTGILIGIVVWNVMRRLEKSPAFQ
ncbi:MAG: Gx transporter family protein [Bilifractor sp.]